MYEYKKENQLKRFSHEQRNMNFSGNVGGAFYDG